MALSAGIRLGPYEILEPLGAGGMGEVYCARDTRLGRAVAIKVLPEASTGDSDRLRRFEQEARAASALNHPSIVTIHDVGEQGGIHFIAMEYVEGQTLRELVGTGPLPATKLLSLATQIAEGLAKAHTAGIVHRDLKPENVMVTSDGLVKILDFGLAKLQPQVVGAGSEVTTVARTTRNGAVVGTAQYMSPEQAAGRPVDYRSDQFSLGLILYEMATGEVAFKRATVPQTLAAIIEDAAEPIPAERVPPRFPTIVARCLAKNPEERYDSTRDLARELRSLLEPPSDRRAEAVGTGRQPKRGWGRRGGLLAAAGVLAMATALAVGLNLGALKDRLQGQRAAGQIRSLAVLPLQNLSGDPEQEYFADGMTEALIADLARIKALRVTSRQSVTRYKSSDKPLPEIARELGVDAVLEGSVLRAGGRVRVTAQLIEAGTDRHLWADAYDRELGDILVLHSEVARSIAKEIQANLTPEEVAGLARARPVDSESYDAYLMGRYHEGKRTPDGLGRAIEYYRSAIRAQPDNALAHSGLADAYAYQGVWGWAPPRVVMPQARAAAIEALAIDDALSEAYVTLGHIKWAFEWDWHGAQQDLLRSIDLKPSNAGAHATYSMYLCSLGRFADASLEVERALELDPLSTVSNDVLTWNLYFSRRFDEAAEQARKLLELDATSPAGHWGLAFSYQQKGMHAESWAILAKGFGIWGFPDVAETLERGYRTSGYGAALRGGADALTRRRRMHYVSPVIIAVMFALGGEREEALRWLEKALEERDPLLLYARVGAYWDSLRSDARFTGLLRRVGFPE